jgi:hypothetical protein
MNAKTNILENALKLYRANRKIINTSKITFKGVNQFDVYNISCPFTYHGKTYIAARVEKRDTEISKVIFFNKISESEYEATNHQIQMMQDPFVEIIDDSLLVGGTEISTNHSGKIDYWRTVFYQGKSFEHLKKIINAPDFMKDVRIKKGKQYYVMTRPQGGIYKWGRIGFIACEKIEQINSSLIEKATIIENLYDDHCWGGANQIHILKNGWLGILGHVAIMSEQTIRHYYGMTFAINPITKENTAMKIICQRTDFANGPAKRPDLIDVVFVGGITRNNDKTATLYTGVSDAEAHLAIMEDPFLEYEELR